MMRQSMGSVEGIVGEISVRADGTERCDRLLEWLQERGIKVTLLKNESQEEAAIWLEFHKVWTRDWEHVLRWAMAVVRALSYERLRVTGFSTFHRQPELWGVLP